ncbi:MULTISPECIES: phage tail tape measure protein [unclassified Shinella]|uniref:phage tail tape measure protein n=1 Tax=unclassified Shinella TaxID=2643062 RepID=UPI0006809E09|nr:MULTISPECIES: phage tail tape measure protein [unclassified Shinella]
MATLTSSLVVRLLDQATGPAKGIARSILGIQDATNRVGRVAFGDRLRTAIDANNAALDRARGQVMDTVASFYVLKQALSAPITAATGFQTQLEDIAQKTGLAGRGITDLGKDARRLVGLTNQSLGEITTSIDFLVGMGAQIGDAVSMSNPIGKAATAYRASAEDLAKASFAVADNLKVPAAEIEKALDIMAQAGKEGGFELRDMAREFPAITAAAQAMGMQGTKAVADLTAALEVARKGTATGAEAANNMANFMQKIVSKDTIKNLRKFGVNVPKELEKATKAGVSPIEHMLGIIDKVTEGGKADKIAQIFGDKQVVEFIRPLLANMEEYRRIRKEAMAAQGVVEKDFASRMQTSEERSKRLRNSIELLNVSVGNALLPSITRIVDQIGTFAAKVEKLTDAHPDLIRNIIGATTAVIGFRGAMVSLKWLGLIGRGSVLSVLAFGFNTLGRAIIGATNAAKNATGLQAALAGMSGAKYSRLQKVADGLKAIALAIPGVSGISGALSGIGAAVAALSAPALFGVALAVAAVAGAGFLLWKYWDRASAVFSGVARAIGDNLAPVIDAVKEKFQNMWNSVRDSVGDVAEYFGADAEAAKAAFDRIFDFSAIKQKISEFFSWLGSFFQQEVLTDEQKASLEASAYDVTNRIIKGFATGTQALLQLGADMIQSLWDGMLTKVDELIAWVKTIPERIVAAVGKIDLSNVVSLGGLFGGGGSEGGSPPVDGARAAGGPVKAGGTYLVGEEGPELFQPNQSGSIWPNSETMAALRQSSAADAVSGGGTADRRPSSVVMHINPVVHINGVQDIRGAAREISQMLSDEIRQNLDATFADLGVRR